MIKFHVLIITDFTGECWPFSDITLAVTKSALPIPKWLVKDREDLGCKEDGVENQHENNDEPGQVSRQASREQCVPASR
jgi:hypothetical protein